MLLVLPLLRSTNQLSYTGTPFNLYIQGIWDWNQGAGKLCGLIYAGLLPCCTGRTQLDMRNQQGLLATTSLDGVRWTKSAPLHQTSNFADFYNVSHLRFEVLAHIPPAQNSHKAFSCQCWVCFARDAHTGCAWPWTRGWVLLPLSSQGSQQGGGSSMSLIHSRSLTCSTPAKLQGLAGLTLLPIPRGYRNSDRAMERWVEVSWRGMAGVDGGMISYIFPFTSVVFNTWFSLSSSQKNAQFSFALSHFKLQDS